MKRIWFWVRLLLSVGLVFILIHSVDIRRISDLIDRSNIFFVAIALIIALADRVLMAYKWSILLKAKAIFLPLHNLVAKYLSSTFIGLFLPATVGADSVRAYSVARDGAKTEDVISSIVIERLGGFIALFVFVLFSILLSILVFGQNFIAHIWNLFWIVLSLLVLLTTLIILSINGWILERLGGLVGKWTKKFGSPAAFVLTLILKKAPAAGANPAWPGHTSGASITSGG